MSSLAQEESRSISENVSWGIRKSFSDGKVSMAYSSFLGYRKGEDGTPEIVPEEAQIVKTIYHRFLEGDTVHEIAKKLTAEGIPTPMKHSTWSESTLMSILTNEKYAGNAILQKTFCTDFLTKKTKKNEGELPQYHVQNSHPAIVSEEVFELTQLELERRRQFGNRYSGKGLFASRIVCAECGCFYGRKVWHSNDPYRTVIWRCNQKYAADRCSTPHIREDAIKDGFMEALQRMIADKDTVLAECQTILDAVLSTAELDRQTAKLQDQAVGLVQRIRDLVTQNTRKSMDQEAFQKQYDELAAQHEKLTGKISALQQEKDSKECRARKIKLFMNRLAAQEACLDFDPTLFTIMVDKVVVSGTKQETTLTYVLQDGSEHIVSEVR